MNGRYPVGTVVSYSCNHGFLKSGPAVRRCQTTGTWTQATQRCDQSKQIIISLNQ